MSRMGHKRAFADARIRSALPSGADISITADFVARKPVRDSQTSCYGRNRPVAEADRFITTDYVD
jgi:hypothetical protein